MKTLLDFVEEESGKVEKVEVREENGEVLENFDKSRLLDKIKSLLAPFEPKAYYSETWVNEYYNKRKEYYWKIVSKFQLSMNGKEWHIIEVYDALQVSGKYETCQLCGHHPCRFMYVISPYTKEELLEKLEVLKSVYDKNELTAEIKKLKLVIGDECVLNYTTDEAHEKVIKRLRNAHIRIFNLQLIGDIPARINGFLSVYASSLENDDWYFVNSIKREFIKGDVPTKEKLIKLVQILSKVGSG